jgi:hypothetical protein
MLFGREPREANGESSGFNGGLPGELPAKGLSDIDNDHKRRGSSPNGM